MSYINYILENDEDYRAVQLRLEYHVKEEHRFMELARAACTAREMNRYSNLAIAHNRQAQRAKAELSRMRNDFGNLDALAYATVYPVDDEYYLVKIHNGETIKGYNL